MARTPRAAPRGAAGADAGAAGGKGAKGGKDAGGAPAGKGKAAAAGGGKGAMPAARVDAPAIAAIPSITIAAPKANKKQSEQWLKETGRTVEQHHAQIAGDLATFEGEIKAKQDELVATAARHVQAVTSDIAGKVDNLTSAVIAPGRAKVVTAYGGLTKAFDAAETKAVADIAKHKVAGGQAITKAMIASSAKLTLQFTAAKGKVKATIAKNVPSAAAAIKTFAGGIPGFIKAAKADAKTKAKVVADTHDPKKGNTSSRGAAVPALEEDVRKNHLLKHGDKLGKQYELALSAWGKDTDKKAEAVVKKALDESKIEFEAALDVASRSSKTALGTASTQATAQLATSETTAKTAVSTAKQTGIKRFETEKQAALDAADAAGKELADNSKAAGTELTDQITKKAAADTKAYAAIATDLQAQLKKGGPHRYEAIKPKLAAARAQLLEAHAANTASLGKLVTEGKTELGVTLRKQQGVYNEAIKDREASAKKCQAEVVKDIGAGATTMGASLARLGTGFVTTTAKEIAKIDGAISAFDANADAATKAFGTKVTAHLEAEKKKLDDNLKANLAPEAMKQDVEAEAAAEIAAKQKSLGKDASALRNAMDGWGTDEGKIFSVLRKCSYGEITFLEAVYNDHYSWRGANGRTPLRADFYDEMDGSDLKIANAYLNHDRTTAIKLELADSTGFWNDDEARIEEVLRGCSDEEIKFLNTDADAKKVVLDVKGALGGCDLDVMTTLLDTSMEQEDRHSKADAVRLFDAMEGWGTDEAKMKQILEGTKSPEERARLRAHFNKYATSKGWSGGDGGAKGESDDALTRAIKDDTSGGEEALMLTLAKTERSEEDVNVAKMYEGADGAGTNENQIFDALDDAAYHEQWKAASPADRKELEEARRARLDAKLDKMSGGDFKSVQGLIDNEMLEGITYQEFRAGKRFLGTAKERPLTSRELADIRSPYQERNKLSWMVAQRKLQTGQAEPELVLAYCFWGLEGTDEELINKTITKGGEPRSIAEIQKIRRDFQAVWGKALTTRHELQPVQFGSSAPGGVLSDELSGKDWNKTRQLMCGKPETAEQQKYLTELQGKYATSGFLGGALMTMGEAVGYTEAKTTAEKQQERRPA